LSYSDTDVPSASLYSHQQVFRITIKYHDKSSENSFLQIQNAKLEYGKWTNNPDDCQEIASPNRQIIGKEETLYIYSCGRESSPSGTEGSFVLDSNVNGVPNSVYRVEFDVPWIGSNKFKLVNLQGAEMKVICAESTENFPKGISKTLDCYKI